MAYGNIQVKPDTAKQFKDLRAIYTDKDLGKLTNDQLMRMMMNAWKKQNKITYEEPQQ